MFESSFSFGVFNEASIFKSLTPAPNFIAQPADHYLTHTVNNSIKLHNQILICL